MKTRNFLAGILVLLLSTLVLVYATSYPGDQTAFYFDIASRYPHSFIIEQRNSTYYQMVNGTTGKADYVSTNASKVFIFAFGNLSDGQAIYVKNGVYICDSPIVVVPSASSEKDYIRLEGESYGGVHIDFTGTGGISIEPATGSGWIMGFTMTRMYFDGTSTAEYGFRVLQPPSGNTIFDCFSIYENMFYGFDGSTTAVALKIANPERGAIYDNNFYNTQNTLVYLSSEGTYSAGNVLFDNNILYAGGVASSRNKWLVTLNSSGTDGLGGIFFTNNQFLASSAQPANGIYSEGAEALKIEHNRFEMTSILNGQSNAESGADTRYCDIADNYAVNVQNTHIELSVSSTACNIHHNILNLNNASAFFLVDDATSSTQWNKFTDNFLVGAATIDSAGFTEVRRNEGLNPFGKVTDFRLSGSLTAYGTASSVYNATACTVRTGNCVITSTGGTGINAGALNITITDENNNVILSNVATLSAVTIPFGYKIICTYATSPTWIVAWE